MYNTHWVVILFVIARTLGVDFVFLWIRIYVFDFDLWLMPQLVKSRFFLWLSKTVCVDPSLVLLCTTYYTHPIVFLFILVKTLGVDFVQLIIGTYRLNRMFDDEDEK